MEEEEKEEGSGRVSSTSENGPVHWVGKQTYVKRKIRYSQDRATVRLGTAGRCCRSPRGISVEGRWLMEQKIFQSRSDGQTRW